MKPFFFTIVVSLGLHLLLLFFFLKSENVSDTPLLAKKGIVIVDIENLGTKPEVQKNGLAPNEKESVAPLVGVTAPTSRTQGLQGTTTGWEKGLIAPEYPEGSRLRGEEGKVVLEVGETPEGIPVSVEIKKSSGFSELDRSALQAVKKVLKEGRIFRVRSLPVVFKLQ